MTTQTKTSAEAVLTPAPLTGGLQWLQSPSITKLMPELIAARSEFDAVLKDATNPAFRSKYSTLSSVLRAIEPALLKHRFLHTQQTSTDFDGCNVVFTRVIHESGEWLGAMWRLNPAQSTPQGEGSALTYARRYTLTALLGIAAEDDDAAAGSERPPAAAPAATRFRPGAPVTEPSGRDWLADADTIVNSKVAATTRRTRLLTLMEECRGFGELTDELREKYIDLGIAINTEIAAAELKAEANGKAETSTVA